MKHLGSIVFILLVLIILPFPGIAGNNENMPDIKLVATISFMMSALGYIYLSIRNNSLSWTITLIHILLSSPLVLLSVLGIQEAYSWVELISILSFVIGQLVFILAFVKSNQT
ncbi:MAG TPA: hypothetical protein VGF79_03430 [Bacteroidia bacterium]